MHALGTNEKINCSFIHSLFSPFLAHGLYRMIGTEEWEENGKRHNEISENRDQVFFSFHGEKPLYYKFFVLHPVLCFGLVRRQCSEFAGQTKCYLLLSA